MTKVYIFSVVKKSNKTSPSTYIIIIITETKPHLYYSYY